HTIENVTVTNPDDGQTIAITVFKPATAAPEAQVPVIFQSHGWAGTRETDYTGDGAQEDIRNFLDAGFGVVSIDQRGHGESGGLAYTQDPTRETEDIKAVIDYTATLDWVRLDGPGDPVLGAIGGSYGGGYQTMTALDEIADEGRTRFNALAPEITWFDLPQSLAPQKVSRTLWNNLLFAVGAQMLPDYVHTGFAWGTATGQWPDGTMYGQPAPGIVPDLDTVFHRNSPVSFVEEGHQIDVPVLIRQGITDSLFPMNEGLNNFNITVSDEAREQSYFIGYHGGHVLPQVWPQGTAEGDDPCSPNGFNALTIDFFSRVFNGASTDGLLPNRYNFTNVDGETCIGADSIDESRALTVTGLAADQTVTPSGNGAPLQIPVAQGPITVTGVPELSGRITSAGLDSRMFFGMSMGTSPQDALLIQNNVMPYREIRAVVDKPFALDLAGIAIEVPEGQTLYLTITPTADAFAANGTRGGGAMAFSGLSLSLPQPATIVEQLLSQLRLTIEGKGSKTQLVATLTDSGSAQGIGGAAIDVSGDGVSLGSLVTDETGVARIALPARYRGANHHFEALFGGNEQYAGSSGTADS
ncbi:MAG TPA: alpha/beta fold hydrolase, partial [Actinomycetota bacterium]|nr:alpha/beta fold hydrolase [Actinomycetota bacterium]